MSGVGDQVPGVRRTRPATRVVRLRRQAEAGERPGLSYPGELAKLGASHDEFACYDVEVCVDCRWNHLGAASSTAAATPLSRRSLERTPDRESARCARRRISSTVRVLRAARDAPRARARRRRVLRRPGVSHAAGVDVDPADAHELVVGHPAVLADVGEHRQSSSAPGAQAGPAMPSAGSTAVAIGRHGRYAAALPGAVCALDGGGQTMTAGSSTARVRPMTAPDITARKRELREGDGVPLVMVTAYDAPSARAVDAAGADMILVGDSLAMVVLGYDDTLQVTTDDMAHHVAAVARTRPRPLVVADLPWLSYHVTREETVRNAAALVRAGAGAVKLEGGRKRLDAVARDPRRRDPGDGPHRPHAAVDPRARRLQGAGQAARRRPGDRRRRGRARRGRVLRARARVRARRRGPDGHRRRSPSRRSASAPAATATARCSCATTCSGSRTGSCPKFVRRYADLRSRRHRRRSSSSSTTCGPGRSRRARRRTT